MTLAGLAARGLRHHWRDHVGVLAGAALGVAILVGALAVGDSVRYSLRALALSRLGEVRLSLHTQGRFFRAQLAEEMAEALRAPVAPAILLRGSVVVEGGQRRAGQVQVVGADERFWRLGAAPDPLGTAEGVALSELLAARLGAAVGEEVLLRVEKPSMLSRDAPLSTLEDATATLRLPVARVVSREEFGFFGLEANQSPALNAFVPLPVLQRAIEQRERANLLLVGPRPAGPEPEVNEATAALRSKWRLADAGLRLRPLPGGRGLELRTDEVFLSPALGEVATRAVPGARGILTYFVDELRAGSRATPYSTVAAMSGGPVPAELRDDEIVLNDWAARDLQARPGDRITLRYQVLGPRRQLEPRTHSFRVRAVVPLAGPALDRELMPDFPGLADRKNCRDWEPGIPIDLQKIRPLDEAYWREYRGTPKAFLTLAAGQALWDNRFGNLTAVRYPESVSRAQVEACLLQALNPVTTGMIFAPIRERALAAGNQAQDFGSLFLGLSFFLIAAALLLTALLFALSVERRAEEVGILLAVGFPPRTVRRLLLLEGGLLALLAAVLGAPAGLAYTRAVLSGLGSVWQGAVGGALLEFHATPQTIFLGGAVGAAVAVGTIWLVTRRQAAAPARELLASGGESDTALLAAPRGRRTGGPTAVVALVGAVVLGIAAATARPEQAAGFFFGAGALLLLAGMAGCRHLLATLDPAPARGAGAPPHAARFTLGGLGVRGSARRPGRSLATVALLACGAFLVVAVGANRHDPTRGAELRSSGTGGFALYAESTLPVYQDLNTEQGRDDFGLDGEVLAGARVLQLRLRPGDEASCLNLNRAQAPRLLGVDAEQLAARGSFTFRQVLARTDQPWLLLRQETDPAEIPVVADENTVVWALGKSLGSSIAFVDDHGALIRLRIVGILANSILQGALVMEEARFVRHFPRHAGYQVYLVDAPASRADAVAQELARGLEDVGFDATPATERLAAFNAVEDTYLSIFAVLGGLGLLLGSAGLGVVVARNVLERRAELAVLRAVGFGRRALEWLVFTEHALLLALGLGVGVAAGLLAVLPALRAPGAEVPWLSLGATLAAVLLCGAAVTWAATAAALRGPLLAALRNE